MDRRGRTPMSSPAGRLERAQSRDIPQPLHRSRQDRTFLRTYWDRRGNESHGVRILVLDWEKYRGILPHLMIELGRIAVDILYRLDCITSSKTRCGVLHCLTLTAPTHQAGQRGLGMACWYTRTGEGQLSSRFAVVESALSRCAERCICLEGC